MIDHNNKCFLEFAPHHGGKTAGIDIRYEEITSLSPYVLRQEYWRS